MIRQGQWKWGKLLVALHEALEEIATDLGSVVRDQEGQTRVTTENLDSARLRIAVHKASEEANQLLQEATQRGFLEEIVVFGDEHP